MPNTIISEGKTTNEAIEKGLKTLGVSKDKVDIKVLETESKKSFFSILAPRVVKVELKIKENFKKESEKHENAQKTEFETVTPEELSLAENNVKLFLDEFLPKVGKDITYKIGKNEYGLDVSINGMASSVLIGYRGDTLYDFQNILSAVSNRGIKNRIRVILDIEGYKEKRVKTLENLALKLARTVEKTGKPVTLEPMQAYERKIIHSKLQDSDKVLTRSIGEEPRRRIVISLKK